MKRFFLLMLLLGLLLCAAFPAAAEDADTELNDRLRYAVALYGISQDSYLGSEKKAGLTFGPAIGEDYLQSYKAHVSLEDYQRAPEKNLCLHWMSWEEIAEQSLRDPGVFWPCLENGCTHAVELSCRSPLFKQAFPSISGDGASCLYESLDFKYVCWSYLYLCEGGWPASRIRATLNGADEYTDLHIAGDDCLTAESCLFSCFPAVLQERIVPKAVISDLKYHHTSSNCVTSYDRLFLFSAYEMYGDTYLSKSSEGPLYQKTALHPVKSGVLNTAYRFFSETGEELWAWLRSSSYRIDVINYCILGPGHRLDGMIFNHYAIAPGFCLP